MPAALGTPSPLSGTAGARLRCSLNVLLWQPGVLEPVHGVVEVLFTEACAVPEAPAAKARQVLGQKHSGTADEDLGYGSSGGIPGLSFWVQLDWVSWFTSQAEVIRYDG